MKQDDFDEQRFSFVIHDLDVKMKTFNWEYLFHMNHTSKKLIVW